jgi:hypothetical protein
MSEDQIERILDAMKEFSLDMKLFWSKLGQIEVKIASLPCDQHQIKMKHSETDIDKHINESDNWRRLIVTAFLGSLFSMFIAVSVFVTVKTQLTDHISYSDKILKHVVSEQGRDNAQGYIGVLR